MKAISHLLVITLSCILVSSCQKPFLNPNDGGIDPDTRKFIAVSGITSSVQQAALNDFVITLKDSMLWNKFMAIYPMLGADPASIKWNLKDPRDLDAAYRLTFYGTPIYSSTGVLFSTPSDYANTHLLDSMLPGPNDNAIAFYSDTQNSISGYDMGCSDSVGPWNEFAIYEAYDNTEFFGFHAHGVTPTITKGLFIMSSTQGNVKRYDNGLVTDAKGTAPTTTFTNLPILIGSVSGAPEVGQKECALATIGRGLNDTEARTFYNIVHAFEIRLGR